MTEIELKFLLTDAQAEMLEAALPNLPALLAAPEMQELRSVYHDTKGGALRKAGVALRLRTGGPGTVQTAKGAVSHHGGVQTTLESETPRPDGTLDVAAIPHDDLRRRIARIVRGRPLHPQVETRITRYLATLALPDGGSAEVALDRGTLTGGGRSAALTELEIELKSGGLAPLYDFARAILPDGGLRVSRQSKAARAFALLAGQTAVDPPALRKAAGVLLTPDQSAEYAARDVLRECFDQISRNSELVLVSDAAEGPHQLRIGLRRLRAAFAVFHDVLQGPAAKRLKTEARWLAQQAGAVRDLDVMLHDLLAPQAAAHPDEPGFATLADHLTLRADSARADLRAALAGRRAQAFVLDLAQFTETRGWLDPSDIGQSVRLAQPVAALAPRALGQHWDRAATRARGIDGLEVAARHDLRKALKALRYAVEFLAPVLPPARTKAFGKRLRSLQDVFGDLNDLAMAQAMLTGPQAPGADDPDAQRAVGWILGHGTARAEADRAGARRRWHALRKAKRPWEHIQ